MPSHTFSSSSNRAARMPVGIFGLSSGTSYSVTVPVLGSSFPENLFAEARVPREAARVDDHVVRLPGALRQVVFGVDHLRRPAFRARVRLEGITPVIALAQVDRAQILRLPLPSRLPLFERILAAADARRDKLLNLHRKRQLRIGRHALDDLRQPVGVVAGSRNPLQRVAVRAGADRGLLLLGPRKAGEPLGVGQLRREIVSRRQLQIDRRGLVGLDLHGLRPFQVVAHCSNTQGYKRPAATSRKGNDSGPAHRSPR